MVGDRPERAIVLPQFVERFVDQQVVTARGVSVTVLQLGIVGECEGELVAVVDVVLDLGVAELPGGDEGVFCRTGQYE